MQRKIVLFAAASAAIAVIMGAMAAHALQALVEKGVLTTKNTDAFDKAVRYQMYHSLALLVLSIFPDKYTDQKTFKIAVNLFIAGIFLFSGSVYILSTRTIFGIENIAWLGPITPLGGLCFIAGWLCLFITVLLKK